MTRAIDPTSLLMALVAGAVGCGGLPGEVRSGGDAASDAMPDAAPIGAWLEIEDYRWDFGPVILGATSTATFGLANRGTATSGVPRFTVSTGQYPIGTRDPVAFSGCSAALPPGGSCVLTVSVTPPALGFFQADIAVDAEPGTQDPNGRPGIYITGQAIGFEVSGPSSIDLGDVAPEVPVERRFTVTALVDLSDLGVGTLGDDVAIDRAASTCTPTLAAGASCEVTAVFVTHTIGWKRDLIIFGAGVVGRAGQATRIEITANVTMANNLAVEPKTPLRFFCVLDETSSPVAFTVINLGNTASGPIAAAIVGDDAGDFRISRTDCTSLAARTTCAIWLVCSPPMSASAATRHAVLSVADGSSHVSIPLSAEVSLPLYASEDP
jgi:hypothetical protein